MKSGTILIVLLLLICFWLTFYLPVHADPGIEVPWIIDCTDDIDINGFLDRGFCVPGEITTSTQFVHSPGRFWGVGSSYSPGVMERMCAYRGGCKGFKDGVALMSCGDIGRTAWLKAGDLPWDGPFLVVDCSQPFHAFVNVVEYGLVVEWGAKTTERWGIPAANRVIVSMNGKPNDAWRGWYYRNWWVDYALEFERYFKPSIRHWYFRFRFSGRPIWAINDRLFAPGF